MWHALEVKLWMNEINQKFKDSFAHMLLKWNKLLCNLECDILMLSEKCCEMKGKRKTKCFIILNQIGWNSNDI